MFRRGSCLGVSRGFRWGFWVGEVDVRLSTGQQPARDADEAFMLLVSVGVCGFAITKRVCGLGG